MLRVFICEDDLNFLAQVKNCVENYVSMENLAMSVACATTNPQDILDYLQNNKDVSGLYFLDLNLECDINGIELAEKIRKYDPWGSIIFITSDGDSYKLTFKYKVEAMDYIVKGDFEGIRGKICECVQRANTKFTSNEAALIEKFVIKINRDGVFGSRNLSKSSTVSVDSRTIMYFEISPDMKNNVTIYTNDGSLQFRGSLSLVKKQLDKIGVKCFCQCQRNTIVNLEKIDTLNKELFTVTFINGMELELPEKPFWFLYKKAKR